MNTELFALADYISVHEVDPSFIDSLEEEGLIVIVKKDENKYIEEEQLHLLEIFTRWHVNMGVNTQGIDAMQHLLDKLKDANNELHSLRLRLRLYEAGE